MKNEKNFYSVIIGTELLNGRRKDAHFSFLNEQLVNRAWLHKASFVIEDDVNLMENIFNLIKDDKDSVMFCFGGIGSTPDDYTREIAAKVFTNSKMKYHETAKELIINQFGDEAYPHRIEMGNLPVGAKLLKNIVNNVPGFYLEDRFFFTPGFPSMSQSMIKEALDKYYMKNDIKKYRLTLSAKCGENDLISLMQKIDEKVDLSSLPKIINGVRSVVISLSAYDEDLLKKEFEVFTKHLDERDVEYVLEDIV